jgi:hypothetical protein
MGQITESAHFANDLGLDSLDTVEVVMAIEEVRLLDYSLRVTGSGPSATNPHAAPDELGANYSQYRSSASRSPTRTPTPFTAVSFRPCCAITSQNINSTSPDS